jgi:hypothetical protein
MLLGRGPVRLPAPSAGVNEPAPASPSSAAADNNPARPAKNRQRRPARPRRQVPGRTPLSHDSATSAMCLSGRAAEKVAGGVGVGHRVGVVDAEDQGKVKRVGAGGQGFVQDAVEGTARARHSLFISPRRLAYATGRSVAVQALLLGHQGRKRQQPHGPFLPYSGRPRRTCDHYEGRHPGKRSARADELPPGLSIPDRPDLRHPDHGKAFAAVVTARDITGASGTVGFGWAVDLAGG